MYSDVAQPRLREVGVDVVQCRTEEHRYGSTDVGMSALSCDGQFHYVAKSEVRPRLCQKWPSTSRNHVEIEMRSLEPVDQGAFLKVDQIVGFLIVIIDYGENTQCVTGGDDIDRLRSTPRD
jgi:hypothetical protein